MMHPMNQLGLARVDDRDGRSPRGDVRGRRLGHGRSNGPARADQIKILVSQDSEYSSGQRT
jgi:hypothetical protein